MTENEVNPQQTENQEPNFVESENLKAIPATEATVDFNLSDALPEIVEEKKEIIFRHPQQILSNKEIQILLTKKEEELTDVEKGAIQLLLLRAKHHNSRPKALSNKERNKRRAKRRVSNKSRKTNR